MLPGRARDCAEKAFVFKPVQILCFVGNRARKGRAGGELVLAGERFQEGVGADGCTRERTLGPVAP